MPARKKPWYLRWWSIALAAVLVLSCFGVVLGSDDESESAADSGDETGQTSDSTGAEANADTDTGEAEAETEEESEPDYFTSAFPVFDPVTESGSGDNVISLPAQQGIITASHSGSSNFALTVLDEGNEMADLPVNTIGSYEGTTAYGISGLSGESVSLEVTADGAWEITIAPIADAPELGDPQEATGDGVFRYTGDAATWAVSHNGDSNFAIVELSEGTFGWDLLVNEIGAYEGTVPATAGPAVVTVNADGAWTIAAA